MSWERKLELSLFLFIDKLERSVFFPLRYERNIETLLELNYTFPFVTCTTTGTVCLTHSVSLHMILLLTLILSVHLTYARVNQYLHSFIPFTVILRNILLNCVFFTFILLEYFKEKNIKMSSLINWIIL